MHDWQRIDREVLMMKRNDALRGARTGAKNGGKNWLKIVLIHTFINHHYPSPVD